MATLSSKIGYYLDAAGWISDLYCARGYPPSVVRKWTKDHVMNRWNKCTADIIGGNDSSSGLENPL
jgi:hypothetical protein